MGISVRGLPYKCPRMTLRAQNSQIVGQNDPFDKCSYDDDKIVGEFHRSFLDLQVKDFV